MSSRVKPMLVLVLIPTVRFDPSQVNAHRHSSLVWLSLLFDVAPNITIMFGCRLSEEGQRIESQYKRVQCFGSIV